jgi:hypothetical protein
MADVKRIRSKKPASAFGRATEGNLMEVRKIAVAEEKIP